MFDIKVFDSVIGEYAIPEVKYIEDAVTVFLGDKHPWTKETLSQDYGSFVNYVFKIKLDEFTKTIPILH